jgi:hypothetical protein
LARASVLATALASASAAVSDWVWAVASALVPALEQEQAVPAEVPGPALAPAEQAEVAWVRRRPARRLPSDRRS